MRITLEYDRIGLEVELPDEHVVKVLGAKSAEPLTEPDDELRRLLESPTATPPLKELAQGKQSACIVISDITRPVPNTLLLGPIIETLRASGVPRENITVLIATGLHRESTAAERREMLGDEILATVQVVDHKAREADEQVYLGESPGGVPIHVDRCYAEADLKILTGLIEPHFMAGFSGGRKSICPGIMGLETIRAWHGPKLLEHENATVGRIDGNPVHEEATAIARRVGCDFIVNCVLDDDRRVTKLVAGDMEAAWREGVEFAKRFLVDTVPEPVDIVVTSSAGYPLDTTFYQTVKGMVAAATILKPGGTIILAAGMSEGVGSPEFEQLLAEHDTLESFMDKIVNTDYFSIDQWQLEELNKVRRIGNVMVVTDGVPRERLETMFVEPVATVEAAVAEALRRHGDNAVIAVMPTGPYVIAEVG